MTTKKKHLLLIDILKIMTLIAISFLHTNEFIFYTDEFPLGASAPVCYATGYYSRFFSIGGQILVMIVYFLFGYSGKSKKQLAIISLFALVGQIVLALIFEVPEWDIYAYIAVSNVLIYVLPFFYKKNLFTLIFSLLMLLIPSSFYQGIIDGSKLWAIITGMKGYGTTGSWPLLPWFFLALGSYQAGLFVKDQFEKFRTPIKYEYLVWVVLGIISLRHLGYYFWTPIGPNYYFFNFTLDPWVFWSNFLPFVFIMRLSLLDKVQNKLSESALAQKISNLHWNKHLGGTYLISVIYLGIGTRFSDFFYSHPIIFDLFFVGLLPVSEFISRLIIRKWK